jgi:predicted permease
VRSVQAIQVDAVTLAFTAGITLLAGLLFGILPSLQSARADLMSALRTSNREAASRTQAIRSSLVAVEIAVAVLLLVGAGLLGRSFLALTRTELGFRTDGLATAGVLFPAARYDSASKAVAAIEATLDRLKTMPGIVAAEAADQLPLAGGGDQDLDVVPIGEPLPPGRQYFAVWYRTVTPGYQTALRMPLVEGRQFSPGDRAGAQPVIIVNQEAARRMWGGKSPVGRMARVSGVETMVIGVVANARPDGPMQPEKAELFLPLAQFPTRGVAFVVESGQGTGAALSSLRAALREVDPLLPLAGETTFEALAADVVALPRVYAMLLGIFAAAALGLALVGVYGVMAYSVAQREREIGVRLALGAAPGAIRGLVLRRGALLVGVGVLCGLGGAAALAGLLRALLFGVPALDPLTFGGVVALLGGMALLACWVPARRATRVDPVVVLRQE